MKKGKKKLIKRPTEKVKKIGIRGNIGGTGEIGGLVKQTVGTTRERFLSMVKKAAKQTNKRIKTIGEFGELGGIREIGGFWGRIKNWLGVFWREANNYLPQIYRFFTARIITIICTIYIIYNLVPLPYSLVSNAHFKNNYQAHLLLGETFLIKNNLEEAKKEFTLAYLLAKNKTETNERLLEVNNSINEKDNLEEQLSFWEKQIEEKENYRDAYLELALLNYQTKRPALARFYFKIAKELDPNNTVVKEVEGIVR